MEVIVNLKQCAFYNELLKLKMANKLLFPMFFNIKYKV